MNKLVLIGFIIGGLLTIWGGYLLFFQTAPLNTQTILLASIVLPLGIFIIICSKIYAIFFLVNKKTTKET